MMSINPMKSFNRIGQLASRRLRSARPGSVLILVVALLVLLALLGTAYISSARIERGTAHQHTTNTEIDLLLEGVRNAAVAGMVADLFDNTNNVPSDFKAIPPLRGSSGELRNFTAAQSQVWLADRIPEVRDQWLDYDPANNPGGWTSVTWPLIPHASNGYQFDSPISNVSFRLQPQLWDPAPLVAPVVGDVQYLVDPVTHATNYFQLTVGSGAVVPDRTAPPNTTMWTPVELKQGWRFEPTSVAVSGQILPAFNIVRTYTGGSGPGNVHLTGTRQTNTTPPPPNPRTIVAADADADGIADSGLWKLPVGEIDGVSYYAAVRVVDNSAGINPNTALSGMLDYDVNDGSVLTAGTITAPDGFNPSLFTSHIGLRELLHDNPTGLHTRRNRELYDLNAYRFNIGAPPPIFHDATFGAGLTVEPVDDNGMARDDFSYISLGDELYNQLGRRTGYGGYNAQPPAVRRRFQSVPLVDALNLASLFSINSTSLGRTTVERYLQYSVNGDAGPGTESDSIARATPYQPNEVNTSVTTGWFAENFRYGCPPSPLTSPGTQFFRPLRALLTPYNPVSESAPQVLPPDALALGDRYAASLDMVPYAARDWTSVPAYAIGDWVQFRSPAATGKPVNQPKMYIAVAAIGAGTTFEPDRNPGAWKHVPWSARPSRTDINTADFRELWRSYYNVMADKDINTLTGELEDFAPLSAGAHVGKRVFKSSIRVPAASSLTDNEQLQLRSAQAAVNAEALRSGTDDIPSHVIRLCSPAAPLSPPVATRLVNVFGQQKQPFITEVLVSVDNAGTVDFIAIELHNPFPSGAANETPGPTFDLGSTAPAPMATPPQPVAPKLIRLGCQIGVVDRTTTPNAPIITPVPVAWDATCIIPAGGYFVIYDGVAPANVLPGNGTNTSVAVALPAPGLLAAMAFGTLPAAVGTREIILTRTRAASGVAQTLNAATAGSPELDPINQYDEIAGAANPPAVLVPFEQFDFTGWTPGAANSRYDYVRPSTTPPLPAPGTPLTTADKLYWRCVFPVNPSGTAAGTSKTYTTVGGMMPSAAADTAAASGRPDGSLGKPDTVFLPTPLGPPSADALSWPVIQLNAMGWPSPPLGGTPPTRRFPFGGFARLGDILQIPFIGSYRVFLPGLAPWTPGTLQDQMSVSMDSLYAEDSLETVVGTVVTLPNLMPVPTSDGSLVDNADEQIGRFCPLAAVNPVRLSLYKTPDPGTPSVNDDYYGWSSRLFDHFTVLSPHDDHYPITNARTYPSGPAPLPLPPAAINNFDSSAPAYITYGRVLSGVTPNQFNVSDNLIAQTDFYNGAVIEFLSGAAAGKCVRVLAYLSGSPCRLTLLVNVPGLVVNDLFRIIANPERDSVQGLVNINTASWKVLSMLPLVRNTAGAIDNAAPTYRNDSMARAIVEYRNQYGPFKSLFDLNKVFDNTLPIFAQKPGFQTGSEDTAFVPYIDFRTTRPTDVDVRQGDYSPFEFASQFPIFSGAAQPVDGVVGDFEEKFLAMTRLSNLVTTRSDSYICYILIQGWRNAGTTKAELVAQRRAGYLIDRSDVSQTNLTPNIAAVPKQQ